MRDKILIVDDAALNRDLLSDILSELFDPVCLENGEEAIEYLKKNHKQVAVMLLDLMMPGIDGYQVIEYMKEKELMEEIPVLIISVEATPDVERKCLKMGVSDFIRKPFDSISVTRRVKNITDLFMYKRGLEAKVKKQTEALRRKNQKLLEQAQRARENNETIIDILGTVVEYRNLESGEHIKRVKEFTRILATEMALQHPEYDLTPGRIDVISAASALHDIGKIAISDSILLKPSKLTAEEFEIMKRHTTRGSEIIEQVEGAWDSDYGKACYEICRYHHERFDGRGYPDGLKGDEIPISAQIVSVADVYDALVSKRVYKKAYSAEVAYNMIMNNECGVFAPSLKACFEKARGKMEALSSYYHNYHIEEDEDGLCLREVKVE